MAVFTSSVFALRKKIILEALVTSGAKTEETAKTLKDAGVNNPDLFGEYTEKLVAMGLLGKTKDGRFYVKQGENAQK